MTPAEIPDLLVVAAIDRAVRHGRDDAHGTLKGMILEHLHIRPRSGRSRQVGALLKALTASGFVEPRRRLGRDVWALTSKGEQWVSRARATGEVPELPEAPQHRAWRESRALAEQKMERFRAELGEALRDGLALLETNAPAHSDVWGALGKRLERSCANVASAVYCSREWVEPSDNQADRGHSGNWHLRSNVKR
jgi:DNA-binding PadR family transcriptional regulator